MATFALAPNRGLEVLAVRSAGVLAYERVLFRVLNHTHLAQYLVLDGYTDAPDAVFDGSLHRFWFPEVDAEPGDLVRLYSRAGKPEVHRGQIEGERGRVFDFYWGKSRPVWTASSNAVVLMEIAEWKFTRV
jgi:hypothetical protein